ncbi:SH2B adapter protein 2-like isoform X1 [Sycon ciliatum]|uniref:SH2B adapter protein 2-like isoform X1 n=1 Tax=Sycon ciliatum TaxID=27933 RepID=UPI0031F6EA01
MSTPRLDPELAGSTWRELPTDSLDFCHRLADVAALQYSRHLQQFASETGSGTRRRDSVGGSGERRSSSPSEFAALCEVFCTALHRSLVNEATDRGEALVLEERRHTISMSRPATACGDVANSTVAPKSSTLQLDSRRISRSTSPPAERRASSGGGDGKIRRSISKRMPSFLRSTKRSNSTSSNGEGSSRKQKPLKKEGVLHQLVDVEGGEIRWAKCRVLVKRERSGHVISFYSPPKSAKPRSGVLCFLINEVRPTTSLELPDCKHSFVVKGINGMEYVLDCSSHDEMISWVETIRTCSRFDADNRSRCSVIPDLPVVEADYDEAEGVSPTEAHGLSLASLRRHSIASPARLSLHSGSASGSSSSASRKSSCSHSGSLGARGSAARLSTASLPAIRTSSHPSARAPTLLSQVSTKSQGREQHLPCQPSMDSLLDDGAFLQSPEEEGQQPRYVEEDHQRRQHSRYNSTGHQIGMEVQPWFHGPLTRQQAAVLVCHGGPMSHGTFLVRESESREGTMVLTFNCDGKAKHLRMSVQADKTVKVQQWLFDNIFHAIDYFKVHPVPLESSTDKEVCLLNYVLATTSHRECSILEEDDPQQPYCNGRSDTATAAASTDNNNDGVQTQQVVALPPEDDYCSKGTLNTASGTPSTSSHVSTTPVKPPTCLNSLKKGDIQQHSATENTVQLPPEKDQKSFSPASSTSGTLRGAPEAGRPRTYFIDGTGFHARNSYVVAN